MKYDVVIAGGGLAGLSCGVKLAESGLSCAIISAGQSALHFSSASLDLLSALPDGQPVTEPLSALAALAHQAPAHPYSVIGESAVRRCVSQAMALLQQDTLPLQGSAERNHWRLTPAGQWRMSWLTPDVVPVLSEKMTENWQPAAVISITGFLDFQAEMAAAALTRQGYPAQAYTLHLPCLDKLRNNPSEFRSVNIARVLDLPQNRQELADELAQCGITEQTLILPACFGAENSDGIAFLQQQLNKTVYQLPTLPPSLLGIRLHQALLRRFRRAGGFVMPGDSVISVRRDGERITQLFTRNHGDIPVQAEQFVLATGSFFSNGLASDIDHIYEPLLNLNLTETLPRREWTSADLFARQRYLEAGVATDAHLHPADARGTITNLYATGAVLGGYNPLQEGCGAGVSLVTAMYAAEQILAQIGAGSTMPVTEAQV